MLVASTFRGAFAARRLLGHVEPCNSHVSSHLVQVAVCDFHSGSVCMLAAVCFTAGSLASFCSARPFRPWDGCFARSTPSEVLLRSAVSERLRSHDFNLFTANLALFWQQRVGYR
eukprot:TRINITY_DN61653_c0_g1_i1.p1 TRINITY_DN61653_c0_g1~~TRINITY_DN61653_c0_g1_i1.p1  ORF type:complete len:115 (-),score=12.50 TRINITY_DN61653_c0_g1_i1:4-348(-)